MGIRPPSLHVKSCSEMERPKQK